jgi:hypothetical protein
MPPTDIQRQMMRRVLSTFLASGAPTSRDELLREFQSLQDLNDLVWHSIFKTYTAGGEQYRPSVWVFRYSGDIQAENLARKSVQTLAKVLRQEFLSGKIDLSKEALLSGAKVFDPASDEKSIELGIYLCTEMNLFQGWSGGSQQQPQIVPMRISEQIVDVRDPDNYWDYRISTFYKWHADNPPETLAPYFPVEEAAESESRWARISHPMRKSIVFISCGQFTDAEKKLGKHIAVLVDALGLEPFFAENVQDLDGLDANILRALRDCAAFITVLHPRGKITRPDGSAVIRASVWIEQEIAIAAYIKRVENRDIPLIAFAHESVSREGIRELLHINPIVFKTEDEVLLKFPAERLRNLAGSNASTIVLRLESGVVPGQGHPTQQLKCTLLNGTNSRITTYSGKLWVPRLLLTHTNPVYFFENAQSATETHRCFNFSDKERSAIDPHDSMLPLTIDYCTQCPIDRGYISDEVKAMTFEAKAWANDREYSLKKSVVQILQDVQNKAL